MREMAKGGNMKGHMQSHNNGSKGRTTYGVLLLLAFGVAIFGVMILHKLRERRIFNLLVKDKEIELIHLKFLLQKEREHTKEAKRKAEEMKSKMQWVRMQRSDLESRILEMRSTISSLKDEQRIIEVALEEKQDEIKMLREKLTEMNPKDSQAKLLSESVQQNEAEIDIPVKVWSVSADDPSNPTINFTTKAAGGKEATGGEREELHESIKRDDQKNSTESIHRNADESSLKRDKARRQGEDRGQAQDEGSAAWRSNTGEQESQELRTAQDVPGNRSTIIQTLDGQRETTDSSNDGGVFLKEKRYDNGVLSMETINHSGQVQKQSKEAGTIDATDWKEHGTAIGGDFADSQGNNQDLGQKYKDGMKLEMKEKHKSTDSSRVEQEHIRKTKGKSRRIIAESKVTESGGNTEKRSTISMRNRKFFTEIQESATNERVRGSKQEKQDNSNLNDVPQRKIAPNTTKSAGTEEGIREGRQSNMNEVSEKGQEREANNTESEMSQGSQEVPIKTAASNVNRVSKDIRNKISDGTTQSQEAIGIIREHQEQEQADSLPSSLEYVNISERDVKADDLQVENYQETGGVIDQSRGISQENRYQKFSTTALAQGENNTIFTDTEQRLAGNLHSSSTLVKNAEMAFKDSNLDTKNDKEPEAEDHSKGSAVKDVN